MANFNVKTISNDYIVSVIDDYIGVITEVKSILISLPAINQLPNGKVYIIKDEGNSAALHPITVYTSDRTFIDGELSQTIQVNNGILQLVKNSGATGWSIINIDDNPASIDDHSITNVKLRQSVGLSVIGRSASTFGDVADIVATNEGDVLTISGGALNFSSLGSIRQLINFIDEGPATGFASGAYKKQTPTGNPFPTAATWYVDSSQTQKIIEQDVTYNSNKLINSSQWKLYDTDGITVIATVTDSITYSGMIESTRTRTIT